MASKDDGDDLYWRRADGTGTVQRLTATRGNKEADSWHPSGRFLAYVETNEHTLFDIMILPFEGSETSGWRFGRPRAIVNTPAIEVEPAFSPDGRWLAYESNESGRFEIYVQPFPGPGGKWQVSAEGTEGAGFATWSRSRNEIFYKSGDQRIMVAAYTVEGNSFRPEKPRLWTQASLESRGFDRDFDLHPDGQRLAVLRSSAGDVPRDHIAVVFNFYEELRRLAQRDGR